MRAPIVALGLGLLGLVLAPPPADAYVVEVTTSVVVTDVDDRAELRHALQAAVDDVLAKARAFTPTLVMVTNARLVGDRLWLRLLLADAEGEATVRAMPPDDDADAPAGSGDAWI
jgi:hypothetical protein